MADLAAAALVEGSLPTTSSFAVYVGKFCFDVDRSGDTVGTFELEVTGHALSSGTATRSRRLQACADTPAFRDEQGFSCQDWISFSCGRSVDKWSYTPAGQDALLENCPLSCDLCIPGDSGQERALPCLPELEAQLEPGAVGEDFFRCEGGWCVPVEARCNGLDNCYDASDEAGCDAVDAAAPTPAPLAVERVTAPPMVRPVAKPPPIPSDGGGSGELSSVTLERAEAGGDYDPLHVQGGLYLAVFDDELKHWREVADRWDDIGCEERLRAASFVARLTPLEARRTRSVRITEQLRPRFWYFTFVACGVNFDSQVSFHIWAKNPKQGFQQQFSHDKVGLLSLQFVFGLLFGGLALAAYQVTRRGSGTEALRSRPLLCTLFLSAFCSCLGCSFQFLHLFFFAVDGAGLQTCHLLGFVLAAFARCLLAVVQLLTARGWALFYSPGQLFERHMVLLLLFGVLALSAWSEIYGTYVHEARATLYLYESTSGWTILFCNTVLFTQAWCWMRETYAHETSEEVQLFYCLVSVGCGLYFLSLPLICTLASALDPWVRDKYVTRVELFARFASTLVLAFCLRPSRLDAMINARLEEGLETIGELREDEDVWNNDEDQEHVHLIRDPLDDYDDESPIKAAASDLERAVDTIEPAE